MEGSARRTCRHRYWPHTATARPSPGSRPATSRTASGCCPTDKRQAMSALYAFSRRVDDIGDGELAPGGQADPAGGAPAPCSTGSGPARSTRTTPTRSPSRSPTPPRRFPLPLGGLDELIDGVLMDVRGETLRDLGRPQGVLPVRRGRHRAALARRVRHGSRARPAPSAPPSTPTPSASPCNSPTSCATSARTPATDVPICPPRTSPSSAAPRASTAPTPPPGSDFAGLVHFEVRRARALFAEGYRLLPMLDRRSGACVAAMAGIYRRLLDRIERDPEAVLRGRVSLPRTREGVRRRARPLRPRRAARLAPDTQEAGLMVTTDAPRACATPRRAALRRRATVR